MTTTSTTTALRVTPALRKAINAAVRANVNGAAPLAECGTRGTRPNVNALNWEADDDLFDFVRVRDLRTIDVDARGFAVLDLYVTTGTRHERELETNVYVFIRDGAVVGSTHSGRHVAAIAIEVGCSVGAGFMTDGFPTWGDEAASWPADAR